MHRRRPGRGCHLREVLIHFPSLAESCNFGGGPFGPPPFSLMPESRFARLSASPHDKSRRRTSGGFHPLPFRLTSGEANHPPQTGRRKTKCRAGADPTQHNKRQHRLGTHNAPQGCFSSALFSPLSREFPSMPPPLGGTGKRTCQLTGGLRPSVAVSSTGESYTYFPRKMEKGRLVCSR